ncbi:archaetidylserine decarboxylase [Gorillibacterium massiliense]|uniref:archaetidylserine decarboxylase n=1 Tax=Gorillibacterium massiliense TaxID=1280390 RepID=UPI0004B7C6AD|nr:archaetidylserine decarboxylase [Gorillibacterium massiliense]
MLEGFFRLLTELSSHKAVSKIAGAFANSRASRRFIPWFIKTYSIPAADAEKEITAYATLNDFFTRRLKPDLRPIDAAADALVSPVDALITAMGTIQDGEILNIKGQDYTVEELLNHSPRAVSYRHGFYFVLYLSPMDYHRIHSPASGRILEREHIPGKVYPVNDAGFKYGRKVLSRNERLITYVRTEHGEIAVVKVGALNVSSIRYADELQDQLEIGGELARFEFGSTVVLLTENGVFNPLQELRPDVKVKMGQLLGHLHPKE